MVGDGGLIAFAAFDEVEHPAEAFIEHGGFEPVAHGLAFLTCGNESGAAQKSQVMGYGRLAQVERGGQFPGRVVAFAEQIEDAPTRGIVQRAEKKVHRCG